MTRERMVQVELTEKEVLMFSQAMYLTMVCLRNPGWFTNDGVGMLAITNIMVSEKDWLAMGQKMLKVCMTAETSQGC